MARKEAIFKMKLDSDDAVQDVKKLDKDFTSLRDTIEVDVSGSISAMEDRLYELAAAGKTNTKEFKQLQKQTADYKKVVIETDRSIDALAEQGRGLNTALSLAEGTVAGFQAFTGVSALLGDENEELLETITKLQAAQGVLNSISLIKQQIQNNGIALTRLQTTAQLALNFAVGKGSKAMKIFRVALISTGIGAIVVGLGLLIANFDKVRTAVQNAVKRFNELGEGVKTVISILLPFIGMTRLIIAGLQKLGVIESSNAKDRRSHAAEQARLASEERERQRDLLEQKIKNLEKERKAIEDKADFEIAKLRAAGKDTVEIERQKMEAVLHSNRQQVDSIEKLVEELRTEMRIKALSGQFVLDEIKQMNELLDKRQKLKDSIKETSQDLEIFEISQRKKSTDSYRKQAENEAKIEEEKNEKLKELQRASTDFMVQNIKDEGLRKKTALRIEHEREREQLIEKYGKDSEVVKKMEQNQADEVMALQRELNRKKSEEEAKEAKKERAQNLLKLENDLMQLELDGEATFNKELEIAKAKRDALLADDKLTAEEKNKINLEYAAKEVEIEKKKEDKKVELAKATEDAINNIRSKSFDLALNLTELFTSKNEESQKRAFKVTKGINIAQTIQTGIQGVVNALSAKSVLPEPLASIQKGVNAATIASTTALSVKKIQASTFNGGGGSVGGLSSGGGSSIQGASAGSFSIDQNQGSSSTDLNPDGSQANTGNSMPTKVYVTEQDITNTQNKVKATEAISTF